MNKPASAPPAIDIPRIVQQLRNDANDEAADLIELLLEAGIAAEQDYITASEQMREVEVLPPLPQAFFDEFGESADDRVQDYARQSIRLQGTWARFTAAEPAPVAQRSVRVGFNSQGEAMYANVPRPWFVDEDGDETRGHAHDFAGNTHVVPVARAQAEIDRLTAIAADHARRVAELRGLIYNPVSGWKALSEHAQDRAEQAEASLAACRALVPKWRENAADMRTGDVPVWQRAEELESCADELDAAIDALRKEAPHAD